MRVLVSDILAKIPDLPDNVRDLVTIDNEDPSLAYVKSASLDVTHTVHIAVHPEDPGDKSILMTTCPCDARVLCWHVTAFYALSKGLVPEKPSEPQQPPETVDVVQSIATESNTDELRRLTSMLIYNAAAVVAEAERLVKEAG